MAMQATRIITLATLVICGIWLSQEPGFEPLLGVLSALGGFIASFVSSTEQTQKPASSSGLFDKLTKFVGSISILVFLSICLLFAIGSTITSLPDTDTSNTIFAPAKARTVSSHEESSTDPAAQDSNATSNICGTATVRSTPKSGDYMEIYYLAINAEPRRGSSLLVEQVAVGGTVEVLCQDFVFADERRWARVRYGKSEGWMSERFLDITWY